MKTFEEIKQSIHENRVEIDRLDSIVKAAKYSERNAPEIAAASQNALLLRIENKILHDNARVAYVAEVLPAVVAEFQKYKGKQYGDKTKEKIRAACKEVAGCSAYINVRYSTEEIVLVPLDENGFSGAGMFRYDDLTLSMKYRTVGGDGKKMLVGNKLQEFSADDLDISYGVQYVDDPRSRAELIILQHKEVKKAWDVYNSACSTFNRMLPSGIDDCNPYSAPRGYIL